MAGLLTIGCDLRSFREVLNYDNMVLSVSKSGVYEAAGTVWMLDASTRSGPARMETLSICQIEADIAKEMQDLVERKTKAQAKMTVQVQAA